MKPVIIIAIAVVLLFVPSNAFSFTHESLTESRAALGSDDPENILMSYYGKFILGVGFLVLPIIGIIIIVLIIRKSRKKNRDGKERTLEEIRKEKTTKGKISLILASVFWIPVIIAWNQVSLGIDITTSSSMAVSAILAFVFPLIAFPFTTTGVYLLLTRNKLSKKQMVDKKEKMNDVEIQKLKERLDKLESDEEKDKEKKE